MAEGSQPSKFFQPFTDGALASLPKISTTWRRKAKRADRIPNIEGETQPLVRDYHSITNDEITVRVPKKVATPVKVETKVWLSNERTFFAYVEMALVLSTFAIAFGTAGKDAITGWFAGIYLTISAGIVAYGYYVYQKRLTMISARFGGHFDIIWGPLAICAALFIAILANFILRYHDMMSHSSKGGE